MENWQSKSIYFSRQPAQRCWCERALEKYPYMPNECAISTWRSWGRSIQHSLFLFLTYHIHLAVYCLAMADSLHLQWEPCALTVRCRKCDLAFLIQLYLPCWKPLPVMSCTRLLNHILSGVSGPGLCSTKQCGKCVQPRPHHIQGPGCALWLHSRPPAADVTGHDCSWEEGRGCRQVCRSTASPLAPGCLIYRLNWASDAIGVLFLFCFFTYQQGSIYINTALEFTF